jgi:F0F1-type ATP synthase delta subunit
MKEFDDAQELTQLQKAEYAAQHFAEALYRECSAWTIVTRKTYGVRSLFRNVKSELVKEIVEEKNMNHIQNSIHVVSDSGYIKFTPNEAYLIAKSLLPGESGEGTAPGS